MSLSILLPNHNEENIHAFIEEIEKEIPCSEIIVACDREGRGKGWAVRNAYEQASGDWIAFIDADGDITARMLRRLMAFTHDFDIVVGSKRICKTNYSRKIITFFSRIYLRILFGIECDTQTGIKLFKKEALPEWEENGWLFDVEILWKAQQRGHRIREVPVECKITKSKSLKTLWKTFLESLNLLYRLSSRAGK
jgi:glycosyltransferase involved in cell wall biosynthesis